MLSQGQADMTVLSLRQAVENHGRSVLTTGGENTYLYGGMKDSGYEALLPIRMSVEEKESVDPVGLMLVIDTTDSMTRESIGVPIDMARRGAIKCVDALNGGPGVYSARYAMMAGEGSGDAANNALLLRRMKGKTDRSCAFICALALKIPGRETLIAEGSCPGVLLEEERGTGGFGYDPLFLYEPLNKTFAEVTEEEKNQISHRARACEKMLEIMKGLHE